jgi:uncharacterized repeat protein (TIGR01451 family)
MIMKKLFISTLLLTVLSLTSPAKILADSSCQTIYGGGQTCTNSGNISINKTVANPNTNQYVDNLTMNDAHYKPGDTLWFKLDVKNTGNTKISKVEVKDVVVDADQLPINENGVVCLVNQGIAVNQDQNSQQAQDNAQFCIEKLGQTKGGLPTTSTSPGFPTVSTVTVATTPATGAESLAWIGLIPTGISGWFLRKKSMIGGSK